MFELGHFWYFVQISDKEIKEFPLNSSFYPKVIGTSSISHGHCDLLSWLSCVTSLYNFYSLITWLTNTSQI